MLHPKLIHLAGGLVVGLAMEGLKRVWGPQETVVEQKPGLTEFGQAYYLGLGRIAKCDGHVSAAEIRVVQSVMSEMELSPTQRIQAEHSFRLGRDSQGSAGDCARRIGVLGGWSEGPSRDALQAMRRVAEADGPLCAQERLFLIEAAAGLALPQAVSEEVLAGIADLARYYKLMGCSEGTPLDEIRRCFRQRCQELHPDKLAAKRLPQEMMAYATRRMAELREAYEGIMESRGMG